MSRTPPVEPMVPKVFNNWPPQFDAASVDSMSSSSAATGTKYERVISNQSVPSQPDSTSIALHTDACDASLEGGNKSPAVVVTPRVIKTPTRTPRGSTAQVFGGLTTVAEEQSPQLMSELLAKAESGTASPLTRTGSAKRVVDLSSVLTRSQSGSPNFHRSTSTTRHIDAASNSAASPEAASPTVAYTEKSPIVPISAPPSLDRTVGSIRFGSSSSSPSSPRSGITDFASRDDILKNINNSQEVRRSSATQAVERVRTLAEKSKTHIESENNGGTAASPARAVSGFGFNNTLHRKSSEALVTTPGNNKSMSTAQRNAARAAELKQLRSDIAAMKQKNFTKDMKLDKMSRSIETIRARRDHVRAVQREAFSAQRGMETLQDQSKRRLQYLRGLLGQMESALFTKEEGLTGSPTSLAKLSTADLNRRREAVEIEQASLDEAQRAISVLQSRVQEARAAAADRRKQQEAADAAQEEERLEASLRRSISTKDMMEMERKAKHDVARLREDLASLRMEQLELAKRQSKFGTSSKRELLEESMVKKRGVDVQFEKMQVTMAFLKSTVVNFSSDVRRIKELVNQGTEDRQEQLFKTAHNDVKTALTLCCSNSEAAKFAKAEAEWPITEQMIHDSFPNHKLENTHNALQTMVVTWDSISLAAKQRLTTAKDFVINSHILLSLAVHVERKRYEKWARKANTTNYAYSAPIASAASGPGAELHRSTSSLLGARRPSSTSMNRSQETDSAQPSPLSRKASRPSMSGGVARLQQGTTTAGSPTGVSNIRDLVQKSEQEASIIKRLSSMHGSPQRRASAPE